MAFAPAVTAFSRNLTTHESGELAQAFFTDQGVVLEDKHNVRCRATAVSAGVYRSHRRSAGHEQQLKVFSSTGRIGETPPSDTLRAGNSSGSMYGGSIGIVDGPADDIDAGDGPVFTGSNTG